ncbi:MAG TPA: PilZ domain-containing protein [Candidatus Omnitrophota bacterium]|nr:PilZ domain-containing protein [Candidatus Omnitrophota bacterium]
MEQLTDNRLFERFQARFPAKFKDARDNFGSVLQLRDACAFGTRLTSKERLFTNDKITIEVDLPDGLAPMVLKGEVVWSKPTGSGNWEVGMKLHRVDLLRMSRLYKFAAS